jgi:hypothetical protein
LLGAQVALDVRLVEFAKPYPHRCEQGLGIAGIAPHHGHRRLEGDGTAAHVPQLLLRALVGQRFADGLAVEIGDLVAADHDGTRVPRGHGIGLGARQAQRQRRRRLVGQRRLVDLGRHHVERQA